MNLFVYLLEYYVIVYTSKEYKYAMLLVYIDSYLSSRYYNYNKKQRKQVIQEI